MNNKKPFKIFCRTIGNLPTSYQVSLTYEEQLIYYEKFIHDVIIPAINETSNAVTEIQDYFENLDVQEEIDNKLEEMAESGELETIIASFLNLNSVLSFDTISDMIASTSIVEGTTCRTLGASNFNDNGGQLYKIMALTDVEPDGTNIIDLNRDDLYAVLITHPKIINDMSTLESQTINAPSISAVKNYCYPKADVYTKSETDDDFYKKSAVYNKSEIDEEFYPKADVYTKSEVDNAFVSKSDLVDIIYPIGSIFISVSSTSPETLFEGTTWVPFAEGRTLVGVKDSDEHFDSVEETGGAMSFTSTSLASGSRVAETGEDWTVQGIKTGITQTLLQPYITTYMYKRTA